MEETVICDTNIWYAIADGSIDKAKLNGLNLVLTFNSLVEFASTDLLYKKPLLVREAVLAALVFSNKIDLRPSFNIVSEVLVKNHKHDLSEGFFLLEEARVYTRMKDKDIYHRMSKEMIHSINSRQDEIQGVCDHINKDQLPQIRNNLENKTEKKIHANRNMLEPTIAFYKFLLGLKTQDLLFLDNPDSKTINALLHGTIAFFKDLELRSERKFKRNDWFDMMNLAYVNGPETLYWTNDKSWINLLKQGGMEHILFDAKKLNSH
jgi:hypothetical protein